MSGYGRWAFEEFSDVYDMDKEFKALIERVVGETDEKALQEVEIA